MNKESEMREIRFRAWKESEKRMVDWWEMCGWTHVNPTLADVLNGTYLKDVMQFSGLHDKNGVEIYEGDILDTHEDQEGYVKCAYNNKDGCFEYRTPWDDLFDTLGGYDGCYVIIGNTHSNPELLKANANKQD